MIENAIRTHSLSKNVPTERGLGLIIPDTRFTTGGTSFLSRAYYEKAGLVRLTERIVKTADFTTSEMAKTEEGIKIMRYGIGNQLELTGGLNPILMGHYEAYRKLGYKQGKMSEKEEREKEFKKNSTTQNVNFTPYINDFLDQKQLQDFEPRKEYYDN